jgi:hypothetical protein
MNALRRMTVILLPLTVSSVALSLQGPKRDLHVKDPVLARLVWLIEANFQGAIGHERLVKWMAEEVEGSRLPVENIARLSRYRSQGEEPAVIRVSFGAPLDVPFPYGILGYKPGRLRATPQLRLLEWNMGGATYRGAGRGGVDVVLDGLRVFRIAVGKVEADFHSVIDKLLGPVVEDARVEGFFYFREHGSPRAAVVGTTEAGKVRVGLFDLEKDRLVFPTPLEIKVIGGRLLHWMRRQPGR